MEDFIEAIEGSVEQNQFVKITLSKCAPKSSDLKNIYVRRIDLKGVLYLSFTYHYANQDVVKNYTLKEAIHLLEEHLGKDFLVGTLLTTEQDVVVQFNKKRKARIQYRKPTTRRLPNTNHNKQKQYLIEENAPFLAKLGVADSGKVLKAHQDKYRQINKYIEVMAGLLEQASLPNPLQVVDMGCGKGYLTFALYDYIQAHLEENATIVGIELREHLTQFCTKQAAALGWKELQFIAQDILTYDDDKIDVLIALHACDIATDIAIAKGIQANAQLIVVAPCCHKQIRKAMNSSITNPLQAILKHGILEERQAEIVTDGIRALLLEAHGYQTKVFEFISSEHTAKNLMITAVKQDKMSSATTAERLKRVAELKAQFGIKQHYLEKLLQ
ncbi:class I SAM-dependent methyltransferase [Aureispira anguillae]|uniref:SAM-dependent methyltransferase n=1 Tax=Aureispira anguillae TaxID=2864201 RepID=A0A916DW59_9BACT|nr:SAM-dependent methyltransferase [Aureispira anguillae]BDS13751.1 SAM-dependent methyltransferase [Aureispira anguillae]